jgi:Ca2+-binding RTX toxin-like protein
MTRRATIPRLPQLVIAATLTALILPAAAHAKVSTSLSGSLLTVTGSSGPDHITVVCRNATVKVNGKNPKGATVPCSGVSEVDVLAAGGNDRVDLSGVGPDAGFGQRELPGGFGHGTGAGAVLGPGNDRFAGGASAFNLVLAGTGDDRMTGGRVRDSMQGGAGNDTAIGGAGRDILLGNSGNDKLNGGVDDDLLSGNAGNDVLIGAAGADLIGGGSGMDRLLGGPGADQLVGGAGRDRLSGGPGNNTLVQDFPKK